MVDISRKELIELLDPFLEGIPFDEDFGLRVVRQGKLEEALKPLYERHNPYGDEEIKKEILKQAISCMGDYWNRTTLEGIDEPCFVSLY